MAKLKIVFSLLLVAMMAFISQSAIAGKVIKGGPLKGDGMQEPKEARLDSKREKAAWIHSWYIPDGGYMENGGFAPSAPIDHIDEATKGKLTQPKLSTVEGLLMTKDVLINFPKKHQLKGAKEHGSVRHLNLRPEMVGICLLVTGWLITVILILGKLSLSKLLRI